jgi:hypothetical protein
MSEEMTARIEQYIAITEETIAAGEKVIAAMAEREEAIPMAVALGEEMKRNVDGLRAYRDGLRGFAKAIACGFPLDDHAGFLNTLQAGHAAVSESLDRILEKSRAAIKAN